MGMMPAKYFPQPTPYGSSPQQGAVGPTPQPDSNQYQLDMRPPGPEPGPQVSPFQSPGSNEPGPQVSPFQAGPPTTPASPGLKLNPNLMYNKKLPYSQGA